MNKVYAFLRSAYPWVKAHWPAITALGFAVWERYGGQVTAWVAIHPKYTFWFGLASLIVAYYVKSPRQKEANEA